MLDEIIKKLEEIDPRVEYGFCHKEDLVGTWDCLVVRKENLARKSNSRTLYVSVRIVREERIPEGLEEKVIRAMREIGWKESEGSAQYEYAADLEETAIEVCRIDFYKAKKTCGDVKWL